MRADAVRGHLDGLLLSALEDQPLHGYAVIEAVQRRSGGAIGLPTGTVYPALIRLERAGLLDSRWDSVGGRRRRVYTLTDTGRRALHGHRRDWLAFTTTVGAALGGTRPDPGDGAVNAADIGRYLASLEAALPGTARGKRRLLTEARHGLHDAASAYRAAGLTPQRAEQQAVADFGPLGDIAPLFGAEIVLEQTRRTSRVLCLVLPLLFLAWQAVLSTASYAQLWQQHGPVVLVAHLSGLSAFTVSVGALALPLTARPTGPPAPVRRWLPRLVGDAAIVGGLAAAAGLAALLACLPVTDPVPAAVTLASAAAIAGTAWSGATCRRTARAG